MFAIAVIRTFTLREIFFDPGLSVWLFILGHVESPFGGGSIQDTALRYSFKIQLFWAEEHGDDRVHKDGCHQTVPGQ